MTLFMSLYVVTLVLKTWEYNYDYAVQHLYS